MTCPFLGERLNHATDQADRRRMQAKLRLIQQEHAGQHLRGKIEQRHQGEEPQRAIGREVRPKGLVRPFGLPAQQHFSVALLQHKTIKARQYPTDMATDDLVSPYIFPLQPVQHRRQVAAVTAKIVIVLRVPSLLEV